MGVFIKTKNLFSCCRMASVNICFLGGPVVGKSVAIQQFTRNNFVEEYDPTIVRRDTFDMLTHFIETIERYKNLELNDIPVIIVANKIDLNGERKVTVTEGKEFAASLGIPFIETSVRDNTNIRESLELLVNEWKKKMWNVIIPEANMKSIQNI